MLSTGAFNALLKTLEEPPEHVKFILATTEPQKLPATILSRCQRFDFKQISNEDIIKRLKIVCEDMKIEISQEALKVIAVLAEGGMRDSLSILERCLQDGDSKIDEDKVKDLVGIPKLTYINKIVSSIVKKDVNTALETIDEVMSQGKDIQNFLWEIIKYVKDILVYKASKKLDIYSNEEIQQIEDVSKDISKEELLSMIYSLSELENNMKFSSQKLVLMQVEIIKLCSNIEESKYERIEKPTKETIVEKPIQVQDTMPEVNPVQENVVNSAKQIPVEKKEEPKVNVTTSVSSGNGIKAWPKIIKELKDSGKIMLYTNLLNSTANEINDMVIGIEFPKGLTPFGKSILERNENISEIERRLSIECGKPMQVRYITEDNKEQLKENTNSIESFANGNDIPFNIID